MRTLAIALIFLLGSIVHVPSAHAQDTGPRVSSFFSGSVGDGDHTFATGVSVGYRFSPNFGFDLEIAVLPDLDLTGTDDRTFRPLTTNVPGLTGITRLLPPSFGFETSGRAIAFLTNMVVEFPVLEGRVVPYITGGGGIANVEQEAIITPTLAVTFVPPELVAILGGPPTLFDPIRTSFAENDLALAIGGGVDFRIWRDLAVGTDLKYMRLFGSSGDLNFTRVGGRIAFRF